MKVDIPQRPWHSATTTGESNCHSRRVGIGSWPCKNSPEGEMPIDILGAAGPGHDRSDQRLDPDDVQNAGQIIGEDREGHLGGYLWERLVRKCVAPMRAFIVPNGCSTVSRRCRMA